jgi:hypothetical protein
MNTNNSSQSNPTLPDHYDVLTHSLVHFREPPSFTNCLDILHNCCYLVDLLGSVDLDIDTEGGLSEQAANAFFWQTRTLASTLRYVALCLRHIQKSRATQYKHLMDSRVIEVLQASAVGHKGSERDELQKYLGQSHSDIDTFICSLKSYHNRHCEQL